MRYSRRRDSRHKVPQKITARRERVTRSLSHWPQRGAGATVVTGQLR